MKSEVANPWADLICPTCANSLCEDGERILHCQNCQQSWPITEGVPEFASKFPYWGEIPREQMAVVNREAAAGAWKSALLNSEDAGVRSASEMILNLDRANWHLLADLPKEARVLDLGAGMGCNSHSLALHYREVTAVEPVLERVQFMRTRFKQEALDNVRVIRTSLWSLPFARESFDLVVMNGVLEWVADGRPGNPRELQMMALKNAAKLLKPGGILYIGIENRFMTGHFVGHPDPHCRMPWVSILPRPLAHWYARQHGSPMGYRHYLYSARGYRKLLGKCGFNQFVAYLAIPSYNHPRFYVPLKNNAFSYLSGSFTSNASGIKSRVRDCLISLGIQKYLEYSFAILATK